MLNQTFYMIIYLLTFYLFDEIETISKSLMRIILQRQRQPERLYLLFALRIIHGDRCDRKTPKKNPLFYSSQNSFGR